MSVSTAPITLTEGARKELDRIRTEQNLSTDVGLRVGVKGGGCSGFQYVLGFDEINPKDDTYDMDGLTVMMDKAHGLYLVGMVIDYENGLDNRGFIFNNPNAEDTCGCGESFSAKA